MTQQNKYEPVERIRLLPTVTCHDFDKVSKMFHKLAYWCRNTGYTIDFDNVDLSIVDNKLIVKGNHHD